MFSDEVHLFIFRRQGVSVRLAAGDRDMPIGEHTYYGVTIERDAIRQTAERAKDKLKIRMAYLLTPTEPDEGWPASQVVGDWWRPHIPSDPISVICLTYNPATGAPPTVEWTGWAAQPDYTDAQLELSCDPNPPHGSAANQGAKWQRGCFKVVYSTGIRGCNLVAGPIALPATLTAVDGNEISAEEFTAPPAPWARVEWMDDATPRSALVVAHSGDTIELDDVTGLEVGSLVIAYTEPLFSIETVPASKTGLVIQSDDFIGTPFTLEHGWVSWPTPQGFVEERPIMAHNNATGHITILWDAPPPEPGVSIVATPNCPGTWAACAARRPDPELHYGGAIYKPVTDPIASGVSMSWG